MQGHKGPLSYVTYNKEGDLLFSCAKKDTIICVWNAENGERLGTYEGHLGMVWSLAVTNDSKYLISGSADSSIGVWDVTSGKLLSKVETTGPVKCVAFNDDCTQLVSVSDHMLSEPPALYIWNFDPSDPTSLTVKQRIPKPSIEPLTRCAFIPVDKIVTGAQDGVIRVYSAIDGALLSTHNPETGGLHRTTTSISFNADKSLMITSSYDNSAFLWDLSTMEILTRYKSDVPVNAACIAPDLPGLQLELVMLGGGQEARDVTTTSAASGRFEARIHHMLLGQELGTIRGHFGPINTLAFHPTGLGYSSGSEDGYIRIHKFTPDFFTLAIESNKSAENLDDMLKNGDLERLEAEEAAALAEEEARRKAATATTAVRS